MPGSDSSPESKKDKKRKKSHKKERKHKRKKDKTKDRKHERSIDTKPAGIGETTGFERSSSTGDHSASQTVDSTYGPALPPHLMKSEQVAIKPKIGPVLPSNLDEISKLSSCEGDNREVDGDDDEMGEIVGPVPANEAQAMSESQIELEKRALQIRLGQLDAGKPKDDVKVREEWMLELPAVNSLGNSMPTNRKFHTKDLPDFSDRSSWTETPQTKSKAELAPKIVVSELQIKERDEEQRRLAKKHKKDRGESLLEIHKKKMRKEKDVMNFANIVELY